MYWLCLICDHENAFSPGLTNDEGQSHCSKCRHYNIIGLPSNRRYDILLDKYLTVNEKISQLKISDEIIPRYNITHKFFEECCTCHNIPVSRINLLHSLKCRMQYTSKNTWDNYYRKTCNKKYKKLISNKFKNLIIPSPLRLISSYL